MDGGNGGICRSKSIQEIEGILRSKIVSTHSTRTEKTEKLGPLCVVKFVGKPQGRTPHGRGQLNVLRSGTASGQTVSGSLEGAMVRRH